MTYLSSWENFYIITGSSAAALTGLMFVVITLIKGAKEQPSSTTLAAFVTPTVVHFCAALLFSAILSAPWQTVSISFLLLCIFGLGGVIYTAIVAQRIRRLTQYTPVLEDWLWHVTIPLVTYTALVVLAIMLPRNPVPALFGIGAVIVLLLFIGLRNSWDTVIYLTTKPSETNKDQ